MTRIHAEENAAMDVAAVTGRVRAATAGPGRLRYDRDAREPAFAPTAGRRAGTPGVGAR